MALKIGDVVQLKSGGPLMTVIAEKTEATGKVMTTWFAGAKKETGSFPEETLIKEETGD